MSNRQFTLFTIHAPNVLDDILPNMTSGPKGVGVVMALNTLKAYLAAVADLAIDIDDDRLHALMCRMALYSCADPSSPDYDRDFVDRLYTKVGIDKFSSMGVLIAPTDPKPAKAI